MSETLRLLLIGDDDAFDELAGSVRGDQPGGPSLERARGASELARALSGPPAALAVLGARLWTSPLALQQELRERWPDCGLLSTGNATGMASAEGSEALAQPGVVSPQALRALIRVLRRAAGPGHPRAGSDGGPSLVFNGVPVGLYRSTPEGYIQFVNQGLVQLLGYPDRETLLCANSGDLYVRPDDRRRLKMLVAQRDVLHNYETQLRRFDGRSIWVDVSLKAYRDPQGHVTHYEGVISDITERRLAEEALWDSETRLRLLVEQMPAVLWSTDRELRFTLSLGAGLALMGLRPNQAVGTDLFRFFETTSPDFPAIAAHRRALQGESVSYALQWAGRAFQAYVEPLRDQERVIVGTIGVALDVTDRAQAEDAYRNLVESVRAIVWRGDFDPFRFSFVSKEAESILGYPVERWTQEEDFRIQHVHPDDRARVLEYCQKVKEGRQVQEFDYRMLAADGRVVWLHDAVRVVEKRPDQGMRRRDDRHHRAEERPGAALGPLQSG